MYLPDGRILVHAKPEIPSSLPKTAFTLDELLNDCRSKIEEKIKEYLPNCSLEKLFATINEGINQDLFFEDIYITLFRYPVIPATQRYYFLCFCYSFVEAQLACESNDILNAKKIIEDSYSYFDEILDDDNKTGISKTESRVMGGMVTSRKYWPAIEEAYRLMHAKSKLHKWASLEAVIAKIHLDMFDYISANQSLGLSTDGIDNWLRKHLPTESELQQPNKDFKPRHKQME